MLVFGHVFSVDVTVTRSTGRLLVFERTCCCQYQTGIDRETMRGCEHGFLISTNTCLNIIFTSVTRRLADHVG